MTSKTVDDSSYYARYGSQKRNFIRKFVLDHADRIRKVYDVGCNNGDMSAQFLKHGIDVLGIDASDSLRIPPGYRFKRTDISSDNSVYFNDCTLFLSLYHHILGAHGLETADRIFFQLLLRTDYLIFDTGNVTEKKRDGTSWYKQQEKLFVSEKELFDHFGIPYTIIGTWNIAGGARSVCVFEREAFDRAITVVDEFRRQPGSKKAKFGLTSSSSLKRTTEYFYGTGFYKLQIGNRLFFGKKWLDKNQETMEQQNIEMAYSRISADKLFVFYGVSEAYGLIYEWVKKLTWKKKLKKVTIDGFYFHDGDLVEIDGKEKVIDFWSAHELSEIIPQSSMLTVALFTYKRPQSLLKCLQSIKSNCRVGEILIFNDDETKPLARDWLDAHVKFAIPVRLFNPGDMGFTGRAFRKPAYMNKAVELAAYERVFFSDDDGEFAPGAIDMHAEALEKNHFCAGSIVRSRLFAHRSKSILQGTNYSFRTAFYKEIGGYNEKFIESNGGGDTEFWYRIHSHVKLSGLPVAYLHNAIQRVRGPSKRTRNSGMVDPRKLFHEVHQISFEGPMYKWFPQIRDKKQWMVFTK